MKIVNCGGVKLTVAMFEESEWIAGKRVIDIKLHKKFVILLQGFFYKIFYYGSIALCWALAAFSVS
jgi:hypothetical protein